MRDDWTVKIYGGLLGLYIGLCLGTPAADAGGTREEAERTAWARAAGGGMSGAVLLLRALTDGGLRRELTCACAAEAWLNYTRDGRGMFRWGGPDLSAENRAYRNLRQGIPAPRSGSAVLNGPAAAEQAGAQSAAGTWGFLWPGDVHGAAQAARVSAGVSHDGNGVYGAMFMAACAAAAFERRTVDELLDAGVREIPAACHYRRVVDAVRAFHATYPNDPACCREYIDRVWSAVRFPGTRHVIPNAGRCVMALLYSGGDFGRAMELALGAGHETAGNAGCVGLILGALGGAAGIPARYRALVGDTALLSGVSGYLNMLDLPTFARELAGTAGLLRGEPLPAEAAPPAPGELRFDFDLPGALHGLELAGTSSRVLRPVLWTAHTGTGCLLLTAGEPSREAAELFFRASVLRADLAGEGQDPVFSPRVCPGQTVECWMKSGPTAAGSVTATPYVTGAMTGVRREFAAVTLPAEIWTPVVFTVPELSGDQIHKVGWRIAAGPRGWERVYVDGVSVRGPMDYTIRPELQRADFGQITPFSFNDGECSLADGRLRFVTAGAGQAFTGNYYLRRTAAEADVTVLSGASGALLLRAQGCRRYYELGLDGEGRVSIARTAAGERTVLAAAPFPWRRGETLRLGAAAEGETLSLTVNGAPVLEARDGALEYGMTGFAHGDAGETLWSGFHIAGRV